MDMNQQIVENWNKKVGKKDLVYILGDFAWKEHGHWQMALNGKKSLIIGNHDEMSQVMYDNFTDVTPLKDMKIDKQQITLCHYCMRTWKGSCHGSWHLFGHSHGRIVTDNLSFDVGVDCNNFTPLSWNEVKEKMQQKIALGHNFF